MTIRIRRIVQENSLYTHCRPAEGQTGSWPTTKSPSEWELSCVTGISNEAAQHIQREKKHAILFIYVFFYFTVELLRSCH